MINWNQWLYRIKYVYRKHFPSSAQKAARKKWLESDVIKSQQEALSKLEAMCSRSEVLKDFRPLQMGDEVTFDLPKFVKPQ